MNAKDRIRSWKGEVCKVCGQPSPFGYDVPDELWRRVVPEEFRDGGIVCLGCFDWFAWRKGINYLPEVRELHYAGRGDNMAAGFVAKGAGA